MLKKCSKCGAEFSCGAETGKCWCMEVQVPVQKLDDLKSNYADCLCASCLKELERNEPGLPAL